MKKLKTGFLTNWNRLLRILMSILGFSTAAGLSSCNNNRYGPDEYGTPSAKYIINGQVKADEGGQPIRNIRVVMANTDQYPLRDTTYTDANGNYSAKLEDFPDDHTFSLKFEDHDGTANGEFQAMETSIEFIDPEYTKGSGSWYKGETSRTINATLKAKE